MHFKEKKPTGDRMIIRGQIIWGLIFRTDCEKFMEYGIVNGNGVFLKVYSVLWMAPCA